ncbi:MAG: hypothetical protein GEU81_16190 [Nitriliruptorales bacterium]|nr:hypothetical protein [Nitriliruptorales bacterium]
MGPEAGHVLDRGDRGLLVMRAHPGEGPQARAPIVAPATYWFDGRAAWMTTAADSDRTAALSRDPRCALYVPPADGGADDAGRVGALAAGRARVFSLGDPLGLTFHAPPIALAMTALAARNAASLVRRAQAAAPRVPGRLIPQNRVVVRVIVDDAHEVLRLPAQPGIAPPLPPVAPADVRRVIAGRRQVLVAAEEGDRLVIAPAIWGNGFALALAPGSRLPAGATATAALDVSGGPGDGVGLAVHGRLTSAPALQAERVTWWKGARLQTADMPPAGRQSGALTLPD